MISFKQLWHLCLMELFPDIFYLAKSILYIKANKSIKKCVQLFKLTLYLYISFRLIILFLMCYDSKMFPIYRYDYVSSYLYQIELTYTTIPIIPFCILSTWYFIQNIVFNLNNDSLTILLLDDLFIKSINVHQECKSENKTKLALSKPNMLKYDWFKQIWLLFQIAYVDPRKVVQYKLKTLPNISVQVRIQILKVIQIIEKLTIIINMDASK